MVAGYRHCQRASRPAATRVPCPRQSIGRAGSPARAGARSTGGSLMPNQFDPNSYHKGRRGRNKQGTARNQSQPLQAWKGIAERLYREEAPYERPAATTRPLTKTGRPRKRMNTQQREAREESKRRNKEQRAAKSEHQRRSEAAKKGWDKLSKAE